MILKPNYNLFQKSNKNIYILFIHHNALLLFTDEVTVGWSEKMTEKNYASIKTLDTLNLYNNYSKLKGTTLCNCTQVYNTHVNVCVIYYATSHPQCVGE